MLPSKTIEETLEADYAAVYNLMKAKALAVIDKHDSKVSGSTATDSDDKDSSTQHPMMGKPSKMFESDALTQANPMTLDSDSDEIPPLQSANKKPKSKADVIKSVFKQIKAKPAELITQEEKMLEIMNNPPIEFKNGHN